MKEKNHLFSATGIPSLFLIFGVLMLVILSLLGYGTSRQDLRSSSLSLEQTSAYYNACSEAADFYSDLVQTLEGFQAQAKSRSAYYQLVSDHLNSQENVKWDSEEHTTEYVKAFSDTQSLAVKIVGLTVQLIPLLLLPLPLITLPLIMLPLITLLLITLSLITLLLITLLLITLPLITLPLIPLMQDWT